MAVHVSDCRHCQWGLLGLHAASHGLPANAAFLHSLSLGHEVAGFSLQNMLLVGAKQLITLKVPPSLISARANIPGQVSLVPSQILMLWQSLACKWQR